MLLGASVDSERRPTVRPVRQLPWCCRACCRSWACTALGWGFCCLLFWLHLIQFSGPTLLCGSAAGRCFLGAGTCNLEIACSEKKVGSLRMDKQDASASLGRPATKDKEDKPSSHLSQPLLVTLKQACAFPEVNTSTCLRFAKTFAAQFENSTVETAACTPARTVLFHTWMHGPPNLVSGLFMKMWRATQNSCARLRVWVQTGDKAAMRRKIKQSRIVEEIQDMMTGPPVEFSPITITEVLEMAQKEKSFQSIAEEYSMKGKPPSGNFIRLLVLHLHGGIFLDPDMLPMRDVGAILFNANFAYESSDSGAVNTGAMGMRKKSGLADCIISQGSSKELEYGTFKKKLRTFSSRCKKLGFEEFVVLPCALFDPFWLYADHADSSLQAPWGGTEDNVFSSFFTEADDMHVPTDTEVHRWLHSGPFFYHLHRSDKDIAKLLNGPSAWEPAENSWFAAIDDYALSKGE